jgi:hypothetical protein
MYRCGLASPRSKLETGLPAADELKIDPGRQSGIQQRPVLGACRKIDPKSLAQLVERITGTGNLGLGDLNGIDGPRQRNGGARKAEEFGVKKFEIECCVVNHERRIAKKHLEFIGNRRKNRLVRQKGVCQSMNPQGFQRNGPLGIDITVKRRACWQVIDKFDAADLDDPVAISGIKTRRLGIKDDLTHGDPFSAHDTREGHSRQP